MTEQTIVDDLIAVKSNLTKKQKVVCDYVIENYQEISIFSLPELAERIGVGQTTIIRFINRVGYDSFREFKKKFQQFALQPNQPTWWHLKKSLTHFKDEETIISQTWNETIHLLDKSMTQELVDHFKEAVQLILQAKMVNIIGFRTSKAPANYFHYMLSEFSSKVCQLSDDSEFIYDRLLHLTTNDIVVIVALSPYTKITIDAATYCREHEIPIVLITDHLSCPISSHATVILPVGSSDIQYSIVPTITLIEALVIEIGQQTSKHSIEHLSKLNKILSDKNITIS